MEKLIFSKYQGTGNDFVLIDARHNDPRLTQEEVVRLCDRRFGIGADGMMILENDPKGTDFYMRYYNSDGGESTMCGNGGRCIALFAEHLGIGDRIKRFNSSDGFHEAEILSSGEIRLQMMNISQVETLPEGESWFVFTGSPHYVDIVEDVMAVDVAQCGAEIRRRAEFETIGGINANFVQVLGVGRIKVRTFERGVEAETLACGTGATAAAMVVHRALQTKCSNFEVQAMGGELNVTFETTKDGGFENVCLTGSAKRVFTGVVG